MSFTVGTKDFRQALRAVSPHACRDSDLPMINRIRCYVDVENVTVAATDRFSAALGLVSVWDAAATPVIGHLDLSLPDVGMILAVFTAGKDNGVDEPEWQLQIELLEKRTVTASDSPDVVSHAVRVTDVSGLIAGEVLEFPLLPASNAFPDLPQLFSNKLGEPTGPLDTFAVDADLLGRLKTAAHVYGRKPAILSTPASPRSPIIARIGESFLGLVMPRYFGEDDRVQSKAWLDAWQRRLPDPSREKVVDLDETVGKRDPNAARDALVAAARAVILTQFGSAAMLERRLGVSSQAAKRYLDELEKHGVVGPQPEGPGARTVLIQVDQLQATLDELGKESDDE